MVCVRENTEGEYAGLGGRVHVGTPHEVAEQTGLFTRHGIERILRYAFEVAKQRPRRLLATCGCRAVEEDDRDNCARDVHELRHLERHVTR